MGDAPKLDEGRTPEERARLAAVRAQIANIESIPGVEVGPVGYLDDQGIVDEIARKEAAVFVDPDRFTYQRLGLLGYIAVAWLSGLDWLRDAVVQGRVTCDMYGIGTAIEGVDVPTFLHLRLVTRGQETPLYVNLGAAPDVWVERAMRRIAVAWDPPADDGLAPYIATGVMHQLLHGVEVPAKLGRNDPCPCGSGSKFKKCCGGA